MDARGFIKVVCVKTADPFMTQKLAPRSFLIFFRHLLEIAFRLMNIAYICMSSLCHAYQREESLMGLQK